MLLPWRWDEQTAGIMIAVTMMMMMMRPKTKTRTRTMSDYTYDPYIEIRTSERDALQAKLAAAEAERDLAISRLEEANSAITRIGHDQQRAEALAALVREAMPLVGICHGYDWHKSAKELLGDKQ